MLKWLMRRRLALFERAYDYDASYARDNLEASAPALLALGRVERLARYCRDVPKDAFLRPSWSPPGVRIADPARSSS
jgi:hypothetical protein